MEAIMSRHSLYISNFKRNTILFCKSLFLFGIIILFCFNVVMPQYTGEYTASLIDKVERLKTVNGPKIVLIGNSNLAFGVNSEELEKAFGMPVVNMGLHGGLGNMFHEQMAGLNVCEGDIYIICHSTFSDDGDIRDKVLAWSTIENHLELWRLLRVKDIYPMLREYPVYLKKCLELFVSGQGNELPGGCYSRDAFNEYGDIILERAVSEYTFGEPVNPPEISDITISRINRLNKELKAQGASLVVAGYPIGSGELTRPKEEFVKAQDELSRRLECPFISDYIDYMYDYSLFYNTSLHLTTKGAELRTQQLIKDLKKWLDSVV